MWRSYFKGYRGSRLLHTFFGIFTGPDPCRDLLQRRRQRGAVDATAWGDEVLHHHAGEQRLVEGTRAGAAAEKLGEALLGGRQGVLPPLVQLGQHGELRDHLELELPQRRVGLDGGDDQIGRASCRERGEISGGAVSLKKKKKKRELVRSKSTVPEGAPHRDMRDGSGT